MAFTDWATYTLNNMEITSVELDSFITPIDGPASLSFERTTGGPVPATGAVTPDASAFTRGVTGGRMSTKVQRISGSSGFSDNLVGIFCMTSSINPITSGTDAYAFTVDGNGDAQIRKYTDGISGAGTILASVAGAVPDVTTVFGMEFAWLYDPTEFGGTYLSTKIGIIYPDFPFPVMGLNLTDKTSPYITSLSEGLFATDVAGGATSQWLFDFTYLYTISLA